MNIVEYETKTSQAFKGHKIHHNLLTTARYLLRLHSKHILAKIKEHLSAGKIRAETPDVIAGYSEAKEKWHSTVAHVEDLNVITALKCNKLLSVITLGLKCNNVIPTSSVTLLTCCWLKEKIVTGPHGLP